MSRNSYSRGRIELGWCWVDCQGVDGVIRDTRMWAYLLDGERRYALEAP